MTDDRYSISDLEDATGESRRTIHHYVSTGLLPKAEGRGPSAYYTREHLLKLRLISLLAEAGLRPELIQNTLNGWSVRDMDRLVGLAEGRDLDDLDKISRWLSRASGESDLLAEKASAGRPAARIAADLARWEHTGESRAARPARSIAPQSPLPRDSAFSMPALPEPDRWERIRIGDELEIGYRVRNDRSYNRKIQQLKEFLRALFAEELERE